ncbi:Receptor expression-enhancing protein 2, partial [Coemansia helicoidea]
VGVGYLHPAYKCFKLLRHGPAGVGAAEGAAAQRDVVAGLLKHWVVMSGFAAAELVADTFLFWMPLVGLAKVGFVAWLVLPGINGADIIYDRVVEPCLARNEETLDGYLQHARAAAHRSSEVASLSAYDRWTGYMQRAIRQYTGTAAPAAATVPAAADQTGQRSAASGGHPGLTDLLQALSQAIPHPAAHLDGIAGGAKSPATHTDDSGMSALASVLTSWALPFSHAAAGGAGSEQKLQDIRSRRQQLQDMVAQLERSERTILDSKTPATAPAPAPESPKLAPAAEGPKHAGALTDASEFEDDGVMVNEPAGGDSKSGSGASLSDAKDASAATKPLPAATGPPSSRRWFW